MEPEFTLNAPETQWGSDAPKGARAVCSRIIKEGANVPLFVGQTMINALRDLGYPCSFMVETGQPGVPLRGTSLLEIWQSHPIFSGFRAAHQKGGCADCVTRGEVYRVALFS